MSQPTARGARRKPNGADIPNAPFRERALRLIEQGYTLSDMCIRADIVDRHGKPATSRLSRALGLNEATTKYVRGRRYGGGIQTHITYDVAVWVIRALGMDPWEAEPPADVPLRPDVWCPTCDDISFVAPDGRCPWCETELEAA